MANATTQPASADSEPSVRLADSHPTTDEPELSPLWGLVLVLGEIAQRVGCADERHDSDRQREVVKTQSSG